MTKPALWHRILMGLSVLNVAGIGYAIANGEPWHAAVHTILAIGFAVSAERVRATGRARGSERDSDAIQSERMDDLEVELQKVRQELSETQERLDFVERRLAQGPDPRRISPER